MKAVNHRPGVPGKKHNKLLVLVLLLVAPLCLLAQTKPVTGTVRDEAGIPLTGATVMVKGKTTGTQTDSSGRFRLNAAAGETLVVTNIGYELMEIKVDSKSDYTFALKTKSSDLDNVVVVAYGTQKKTSLTGSVATVGGKDLRQSPATNLTNSLAGRLPGLVATQRGGEPGGDGSSLQVRGVSTLGDNSPLIIVDGIPGRSLSQINPNDVESITILKDASAAAYGARSANGVILVTTRRGTSGKTEFSYSGSYGWQLPTRLPEFVNSYDFARLNNLAAKNDNPNANPTFSDEAVQKYLDGSDRDLYPNTNFIKESLRPSAPQTQHTVTLRGGGKQARFFASAGYFDQSGLWYGNATNFKRYNISSNVDYEINANLKGSLDIQGRQENRNYPGVGASTLFSHILRPGAVWPLRYSNGLMAGGYNNAGQNPLLESSNASGFTEDVNNVLQTKLTLRQKLPFITKGLAIEGMFAYDKSYRHIKNWSTPFTYYVIDRNTREFNQKQGNGTLPSLSENYRDDRNSYGRLTLDYLRDFGDHNISAVVLYEYEEYRYNYLSAGRRNYAIALPFIARGTRDENLDNNSDAKEYGRESIFGRVNYSFSDKYLLEAALRMDRSANFPADKRLGYFPSVSAGWVISNEPWFQSEIIKNLKLRASWSIRGNDILVNGDAASKIIRYQFLPLYDLYPGGYVFSDRDAATLAPRVLANPNITWEKAKTYNIGVNATLFSNKLSFDADVFVKKTRDILDDRILQVPDYTGIILPKENLSRVTTKGFETQTTYRDKIGKVSYFVSANFNYAKSKMDYRAESPNVPEYQKATGHPVGVELYYIATGFFQSADEIAKSPAQFGSLQPGDIKYQDFNSDGKIDGLDRVIVDKTQNPWTTYGLSLGANWKGFDISVMLQGALSSNLYLEAESAFPFFNGGNLLQDWVGNYWTPENPNAKYPRLFLASNNNTQKSTFWLKNADYLRIKNIEIGYNLPSKLAKKMTVNSFRVYANALNFFTFDGIKTFDPEYPSGRGWTYPQQKVISLGVSVQF